MPGFSVSKSVRIDAPVEKVYEIVRDFRQWQPWSPWLIAEPACNIEYADDGRSYTWDGKVVGSGKLAVSAEETPKSIDYALSFYRPWKSENICRFLLRPKDGGTEATWTMEGSLPFFLFFMKKMMTVFIGMDYTRGLGMLKDYAETGDVPSKLEFEAGSPFPGCKYIGVRSTCAIDQIGPVMEKSFGTLMEHAKASNVTPAGPPFSIYHKWQIMRGLADTTAGVPVERIPDSLPAGLVSGELPPCRAYTVRHTGPYRHLGNAWSAGEMRARAKPRIFTKDKSLAPFEVYENDPDEVPENEVVTVVHIPSK